MENKRQDKAFLLPNQWLSIGAFILLLFLFLLHNFAKPGPRQMEYSEFKSRVKDGTVSDLVIDEQTIQGQIPTKFAAARQPPGEGEKASTSAFTVVRVADPELVADLDKAGIGYRGKLTSEWLPTLLSWILPLGILIFFWSYVLRRMGPGAGFAQIGKSKAKAFIQETTGVTFEDVEGIDEAEEELVEIVQFLKNPQKYQRLGGQLPKGVLLVGPPGTGKTLLARAVAGEAGVPFFSITGSDFVEMFVGVGAARVRDLFAQAVANAPSIIFVDELDALGKARGMNPLAGHDEREQTLNQLLAEMDGFDPNKGVILMAATNRPEILDPALLRPGRFDRQVLVDRPDIKGRAQILRLHAQKIKLSHDVDLSVIAAKTPGFVGADLANIVNEAALLAARRDKDAVEAADFDEAIDRIVAGLQKKSRVMRPVEKKTVAYHESGHALAAELVEGADPVSKISIIPRGIAALGYTQQLPTEDRFLLTRSELLARVQVLLGGRVAEEMVFKDISTGAQNDLQRATDIARTMVTQYGMSEKLGLATLEGPRTPVFLPIATPPTREYSEETARAIDKEVNSILDDAHARVREILAAKRPALDTLAELLLKKEVVERPELLATLKVRKFHREKCPNERLPSRQTNIAK